MSDEPWKLTRALSGEIEGLGEEQVPIYLTK